VADPTTFTVDQEHFQGSLGELAQALRSGALPPMRLDLYRLVRDYLGFFESLADVDLELASEALPRVAQVVELKVRLLLPRPPSDAGQDEEAVLEEALSAVALLEELEEAVRFLRLRRDERRLVLPARAPRPDYPRPERPLRASLGDLARLAARHRVGSYFELALERLTLASAMRRVMAALKRVGRGTLFELADARDWAGRTVSFAALMELVRQGRVRAHQHEPFGTLTVERGPRADAPPDGSDADATRPAAGAPGPVAAAVPLGIAEPPG
jgi:segregation and condensation protein A